MSTPPEGEDAARPQPQRTIRLLRPPSDDVPGKVVIRQRKGRKVETTSYLLKRLESQLGGQAFELAKIVRQQSQDGAVIFTIAERYHVLLLGEQSTCECKGFLRWNKPCRHIAGLLQLIAQGKLS